MGEVPVSFPDDEPTAEVIASRLRADGIAARVDRGLHGSWQVPSRGQITVLVEEHLAERAHQVLGTKRREEGPESPFLRLAIALLILALVIGAGAAVVTIVSR